MDRQIRENILNMARKILILSSKINKKNEFISSYLNQKIEDVDTRLEIFDNLFFDLTQKTPEIYLDNFKQKISDFDFVLLRGVGKDHYSIAGSTALILEKLGVKYADSIYKDMGPARDKFASLIKLFADGLPVLPSMFCVSSQIEKNVDYVISRLGSPVIAKEFMTQHGKGIRTLRLREDFKRIINDNEQYLFQKFIDIDSEYRFLVMGGKLRSVQKMYRDTSNFKLSIDFEKEEEFIDIKKFDKHMIDLAVKASSNLNLQVAGVDLAIEKGTGNVFVLEVNRGPGFTYNTDTSPEIPALSDYINEQI